MSSIVDGDLAGDAADRDRIVHAVNAAQERRLAATRRSDECRDATIGNVHRHVMQGMLFAVVDVDVLGDDLGQVRAGSLRGALKFGGLHVHHFTLQKGRVLPAALVAAT